MDVVHSVAEPVFPCLSFTTNLPEDHSSGMIPCLDLQLWVTHSEKDATRTPVHDQDEG